MAAPNDGKPFRQLLKKPLSSLIAAAGSSYRDWIVKKGEEMISSPSCIKVIGE